MAVRLDGCITQVPILICEPSSTNNEDIIKDSAALQSYFVTSNLYLLHEKTTSQAHINDCAFIMKIYPEGNACHVMFH